MGETILVADDEPGIRRLLHGHLTGCGYRIVEAEDGARALEAARDESPDLVLTDLQMPRMGGLELLTRLRAAAPELPVIMMTAYPDLESAREALRLGAYEYLIKPFTLEEVRFAAARALAARALKREREGLVSVALRILREPLGQARVGLELLEQGTAGRLAAGPREIVRSARQRVERATATLRRLQTLRLLERNQLYLRREAVDVSDLLRRSAASLRGAARTRGKRVVLRLPESGSRMSGDRELLSAALTDLLEHALDRTVPAGAVEVRMRPGSGPCVELIDGGPPIPAPLRRRVFEPFGAPDGDGLTLPFCRRVLEAHGGELTLEAAPGDRALWVMRFRS
jgi:CheY-like chemotaxis protein